MKGRKIFIALVLSCTVLMSSCAVGSFSMFNKCIDFNNTMTKNKYVNAIVSYFLLPFEASLGAGIIDFFILNTIEFWTGSNPLAETVTVKSSTGDMYAISPAENGGYTIKNMDTEAELSLLFDESSKTWTAECDGLTQKLITMIDASNAVVYLEGEPTLVPLSNNGVNSLYLAQK